MTDKQSKIVDRIVNVILGAVVVAAFLIFTFPKGFNFKPKQVNVCSTEQIKEISTESLNELTNFIVAQKFFYITTKTKKYMYIQANVENIKDEKSDTTVNTKVGKNSIGNSTSKSNKK